MHGGGTRPSATVAEALAAAAPGGGIVAVPGGRRVFDLFLDLGFDAFHLSRVAGVRVGDGVPLFSAVAEGMPAAQVLAARGLVAGAAQVIDPVANVTLTVWRRAPAGLTCRRRAVATCAAKLKLPQASRSAIPCRCYAVAAIASIAGQEPKTS